MPNPTQDPQSGGGGANPPNPGPGDLNLSKDPNQTGGKPDGSNPDSSDSGKGDEGRFITRETLQGSQNALKRFLQEDLKKSASSLKEELSNLLSTTLEEKLSSLSNPDSKDKGKDKDGSKADPETAKILREHQDAVRELQELKSKLSEAQDREKGFRFKTRVMDGLQKLGCKKPEFAFRIISSNLKLDEENPDRVFATVKGDWGDEEVELDDYLVRFVRDDMIPELFEGVSKPGSPAGGDTGGAHYLFTREQVTDPEFYRANKEKIRAALERGLVKGMPKPGEA